MKGSCIMFNNLKKNIVAGLVASLVVSAGRCAL